MNKFFFLIIFACLLLSGCSGSSQYPTDDAYHFETDAQYMLFPTATERVFAESEDGYYFNLLINGKVFMFFADKGTMQPVPVCNRPNCLHYKETDEERRSLCTANIPGLSATASMFYYNGALYIPEYNGPNEIVIMQYTPDGSSKKPLLSLGGESSLGNCMVFHRGCFYVEIDSIDEERNSVSRIWKYSLDNPGRKRECIFESVSEGGSIMDLQAIGNHLYFSVMADGAKRFYELDLRNNKSDKILDIGDVTDFPQQMTRFQDKLFFSLLHSEPGKELYERNTTMYTADLDGGNIQEWKESPWAPFVADGQYVYEYDVMRDMENRCIRIYDADGRLLVNYSLTENGMKCREIFVGTGGYVFIYNLDNIYYFSKSEIAAGKISPKLLMESPY